MDKEQGLKVFQSIEYSHYMLYLNPNIDLNTKSVICRFFLGFILKFYPTYELVWFTPISIDALGIREEFKYGKLK